eukprot:jgi/Tetstr1/429909/TSEL_019774.t1
MDEASPADRELVMKVIYDDGDSEELTESEIQPLYLTIEQLSDFTHSCFPPAPSIMAKHVKLLPGFPYSKAVRSGGMAIPLAQDNAVLSAVFDECLPRETQTGIPYPLKKTPRKQANVRNYLARYYFKDEGKDGQGGRKGPLLSEDRLAKALHLAEDWQQSKLGRHYQAGKCPPSNVMFKGEVEVCDVTPHSEAAVAVSDPRPVPTFGGKPIVSSVKRSWRCLGRAPPHRHSSRQGFLGMLKQQQKEAAGSIKHNTNAVKNLAAMQAVSDDNVDEGSSTEPPAKRAKQPAKPAAEVPARVRLGGGGAKAGGGALGSR